MQPADDYPYLQQTVHRLFRIDLRLYKESQLRRRLANYLRRVSLPSLGALAARLEQDPASRDDFLDFLTINVSEFFRNGDRFVELVRLLPPTSGPVQGWSAGCSHGAEAYTLALLLAQEGRRFEILGTDLDPKMIARAREAVYRADEVREVPQNLLERFFESVPAGYRVRSEIRRHLRFATGDLLLDPYPAGMDVAMCRNVVIYFTEEAKERVLRGLVQSLRPGGLLLTGSTESIFDPSRYGLVGVAPFIYRRQAER